MMELLPWDTEFFGFRVGRLYADALTASVASEARKWCRSHDISCLYFLGSTNPSETAEGFQYVDERVTYRWEVKSPEELSPSVRPVEAQDLGELEVIARRSHRDTRFYADPFFSRERCDELYATWIRQSCEGWADAVFVCLDDNRAAGYITCRADSIGLIAVAEHAQGRGLGRQLVTAAQRYFWTRGAAAIEVVTQGRNQAAKRLYERCGFEKKSTQGWYHLHV
jgi:dTDP-4-amino-4,6-dideoxy-D-galactose acyltransferase